MYDQKVKKLPKGCKAAQSHELSCSCLELIHAFDYSASHPPASLSFDNGNKRTPIQYKPSYPSHLFLLKNN